MRSVVTNVDEDPEIRSSESKTISKKKETEENKRTGALLGKAYKYDNKEKKTREPSNY